MQEPLTSLKGYAQRLREIRDKARELKVEIASETKRDLTKTIRFFEVAAQRSTTMVHYLLDPMQA
jgi:hypothetical protein